MEMLGGLDPKSFQDVLDLPIKVDGSTVLTFKDVNVEELAQVLSQNGLELGFAHLELIAERLGLNVIALDGAHGNERHSYNHALNPNTAPIVIRFDGINHWERMTPADDPQFRHLFQHPNKKQRTQLNVNVNPRPT